MLMNEDSPEFRYLLESLRQSLELLHSLRAQSIKAGHSSARDFAIAITHVEDAKMRVNRAIHEES